MAIPPQDEPRPAMPPEQTEDVWEGEPLRLANGAGTPPSEAEFPPGEETIDRPLMALLPARHGPAATWLARWVLLTSSAGLALALASVATAALSPAGAAHWRTSLVAVDAAILMLVVRWLLEHGSEPGALCRRTFALGGLAVSALLLLATLLHSATGIIHARPVRGVLTEFLVLSLLGLAGCLVFFQSARGVRWACRTAATAAAVFLAIIGLQTAAGDPLLTDRPVINAGLVVSYWPGLVVLGVCGAGLAVAVEIRARTTGRRHLKSGLVMAWVAILVTVVGLFASRLEALHGMAGAAHRLCTLAFACVAAALAPILLPGILSAWRRRGPLSSDLRRAVEFAFTLVGLGGIACLTFWAAVHYTTHVFPSLLVSWGIVAGLVTAWLGRTDDEWLSRWGVLPAAAVSAACLCALPWLLELADGVGGGLAEAWRLAVGLLWCTLVVGLVFAAFGALVRRAHYRAEHRAASLRSDLRLLTTSGWTFSAFGLAVALALVAARPESAAGLRSVLHGARILLGDLLALGIGQAPARGLLRSAATLAGRLPAGLPATLAAGAMAVVLVMHVCAAGCWRGALWAVSVLWGLILAAGVAFAILYSSRLFLPLPEPDLVTAFGRFLQAGFAARLLLLAVLAGLLFRFGEGLVSSLHLARNLARSRRTVLELAATSRDRAPSGHLAFLVALGVLLSAAGMGAALLLSMRPDVEAALYQAAQLAVRSAYGAAGLALRVGRMATQWGGYAVAFGLIAYLLLAAHEEARRQRVRVYPVVGAAWLLFLAPVFLAWVNEVVGTLSPPDPGRTAALAAAGVLICVFLAATLALWVRWSRLYGMDPELIDGEDPSPGFAQSLGSVGLLLVLATCAVVVHGALRTHAFYREPFSRAVARLHELGDRLGAVVVVLRGALAESGRLQTAVLVTAAVSGGMLVLHALARYRVRGMRSIIYGVWLLVALACVGGVCVLVVMFPLGTWTGPMVLGALGALAVAGRTLVALARPGDWLEAGSA